MHPISMKNMSNYIIRLAVYYVYYTTDRYGESILFKCFPVYFAQYSMFEFFFNNFLGKRQFQQTYLLLVIWCGMCETIQ